MEKTKFCKKISLVDKIQRTHKPLLHLANYVVISTSKHKSAKATF